MFNPQVKRELDLSLLHSLANDYLFKAELVLVVGLVKTLYKRTVAHLHLSEQKPPKYIIHFVYNVKCPSNKSQHSFNKTSNLQHNKEENST